MAIIKCKMCGGDLNIEEGMTVCECEYCGSKQTVPTADSEKKLTLFARANRLRAACEFDKAAGVYESIVADFPEEAEAYWGLVLCRYGIEYVDDPATGKKVPTCHRSSFESIMEDADFDQACENADAIARRVYRDEAKQLEEIRKGIIEVSGKEEPYDIFICYKETDENGERTRDSLMAQDIYYQLTQDGYRVFFSRITLEDKAGTEFEPYIFAALNSAKVMVAVGTRAEHFNAVWVKNEWSRFLAMMRKDHSKLLLPCYRDMDPYDLPEQLSVLQSYDMSKIGFIQDLIRGIKKVLAKDEPKPAVKETIVVQQTAPATNSNVEALLKRGFMALEDEEWQKADDFFEEVLNQDAENANAYLGKLMAELKVGKQENLKNCAQPFDGSNNYQKVLRFGDSTLVSKVKSANEHIVEAKHRATEEKAEAERHISELAKVRARIRPAAGLITAKHNHTVGLRTDGSVIAAGANNNGECDVDAWRDIVAIAAGIGYTVGLKSDGTVVATKYTGDKEYYRGQCEVSGWRNIIDVAAGLICTVGLRADGTVVATEEYYDVGGWQDIVAIDAGLDYIVGLRANGSVAAVEADWCDVDAWCNIVAIAAGSYHTVGLKADGTVVATRYTGADYYGECEVDGWRDIVAIAAGFSHTVGLKLDGTVVAVGNNDNGQCDVSTWRDIVAIAAGGHHTVGLKANGTVVATKFKGDLVFNDSECEVDHWKLFKSIDTLEEERAVAKEAAKEVLYSEKSALSTELANLHGLFTGKRRKEIEARLAELDAELKKLQ